MKIHEFKYIYINQKIKQFKVVKNKVYCVNVTTKHVQAVNISRYNIKKAIEVITLSQNKKYNTYIKCT